LRGIPATHVLYTDHFAVRVADVCSGLEGMGLMLAFCSAWLIYFRREYRFPRALILIPAGLLVIFALNIVRISVLMAIGNAGFPGVAVYGFHSQAGWIAFNAAAGGIAYTTRRSRWLSRSPSVERRSEPQDNPTATYLLPFLAILAAGMLATAVSSGFETLYVLRLIAATIALKAYWPQLTGLDWRFTWRGIATGIAVFAIWIGCASFVLHPAAMPQGLRALPGAGRVVWIATRVAASVITVPLAEELAFRGYLMRRVIARDFERVRFGSVGLWPLIVTSALFGFSHGALWLPGVIAGVAFGTILIRTGRIGEAVAAHATTNGLVSAYVLAANQWQLW
jgi:exosortase E/protease (VPEID-CTERM system)